MDPAVWLTVLVVCAWFFHGAASTRRQWELGYMLGFFAALPPLLLLWVPDEIVSVLVTVAFAGLLLLVGAGFASLLAACVLGGIFLLGHAAHYPGLAWWGTLLCALVLQLVGFSTVRDRLKEKKRDRGWTGSEVGGPFVVEGEVQRSETALELPLPLAEQRVPCSAWWLRQGNKVLSRSPEPVCVRTAHGDVLVELNAANVDFLQRSHVLTDDEKQEYFASTSFDPDGGSATLAWVEPGQTLSVRGSLTIEPGTLELDRYRGAGSSPIVRTSQEHPMSVADRALVDLVRDARSEGVLWVVWGVVYGAVGLGRLLRP